jgi:type IV pilus assembly protein PilV
MSRIDGIDPHGLPAQKGFTMLEVLITLFIIALAVLGTAGLQSLAIKIGQGGQLRTQAVILGLDILERIEANNPSAITGAYAVSPLPSSFATNCSSADCVSAELATYDLVQFQNKLDAQLPGATVSITMTGGGPWVYTVQISWTERIAKGSTTAVTTTGPTTVTGSGATESFSYTVSKTIYDRSVVV